MVFVRNYRKFLSIGTPEKELVHVKELLLRVKRLFRKDPHLWPIELEIEMDSEDLKLFIDSGQIIQVLVNLCKNAFQSLANSPQVAPEVSIHACLDAVGKTFVEVETMVQAFQRNKSSISFFPFILPKNRDRGLV